MVARGQGSTGCRWGFAALIAIAGLIPGEISAQSADPPRPPAPIGLPALAPVTPAVGLVTPGAPTVVTPPVAPAPAAATPATPPPAPAAAQSSLVIPPGQVALMVSARFGHDPPTIPGALHWRVYTDRPDANGVFRVIKEDRTASPTFVLPPGGYVVDVSFGLANLAKRVQLRADAVREIFEISAAPLGGCLHQHLHVPARQDRVEHRVCRLVDRVRCEVDCVACVGLGPLGAELRCLEVLPGLRLVDPPANVLTMLRPVALNLLPMSFALVRGTVG